METITVGVVGLGTMGAGIAQVCLEAGHAVVGVDAAPAAVERGRARIEDGLRRRVEKGVLPAEGAAAALARLGTGSEAHALAGADVVVEAVVEDLEAKRALVRGLADVIGEDAILATNTSALSVTAIAAAAPRPERVVGLHFFNPAPLMPLVEVVRTPVVEDAVFERAMAFVRGLGKEAVACPDTPGFLVNRVLIPVLNDAVRTLEETGVSPEDLDRAMRAGAGWPMGPCALVDLIGVDVQVHASEALWQATREPRFAPPTRLVRMLEAGHLGRKAGRGFYPYG